MLSWSELSEWQNDWQCVDMQAIEKRRVFVERMLSSEREAFVRAVDKLRTGRTNLVRGYADIFADQMKLDSSVARTTNPDRLLRIALKPGEDDLPDPESWFEAVSRFDQALGVMMVNAEAGEELLDLHMSDLIDFLELRFFKKGLVRHEILAYHDPAREYIVRESDIGIDRTLNRPGLTRRKSKLACRRLLDDTVVFMDDRVKDPFDRWLKLERQRRDPNVEDPTSIFDSCGFLLLLKDKPTLFRVAHHMRDLLVADGAKVIEDFEWNLDAEDQVVDRTNSFTSPKHRFGKMVIEWGGQVFEFQFQTYHDYYTSLRSLTDANHELYKLKQLLKFALQFLWPVEIYKINWKSPQVHHALRTWKEAQLGLRVNGEHLSLPSDP